MWSEGRLSTKNSASLWSDQREEVAFLETCLNSFPSGSAQDALGSHSVSVLLVPWCTLVSQALTLPLSIFLILPEKLPQLF